jgi:anti-anti-sigma regulatory factor
MTGESLHDIRYRLHQGPLTLSVRQAGEGDCLIEAKGLIDETTAHALRAVLLPETEQGPVVLDGSGVVSCSASGAHVVIEAVGSAAEHEQTLHVTPSSRALVAAFGKAAVAPPSGLFESGESEPGEQRGEQPGDGAQQTG